MDRTQGIEVETGAGLLPPMLTGTLTPESHPTDIAQTIAQHLLCTDAQ